MNIEIHTPELERRVRDGVVSGRYHDVDELLARALDALSEKEAANGQPPQVQDAFDAGRARQAVARIRELRKGVRLDLQGQSIRELAHTGHKY